MYVQFSVRNLCIELIEAFLRICRHIDLSRICFSSGGVVFFDVQLVGPQQRVVSVLIHVCSCVASVRI